MERIDKVVVEIASDETKINEDILLLAPILVLDEDGNPLNVNANPSQVEIHAQLFEHKRSSDCIKKAREKLLATLMS